MWWVWEIIKSLTQSDDITIQRYSEGTQEQVTVFAHASMDSSVCVFTQMNAQNFFFTCHWTGFCIWRMYMPFYFTPADSHTPTYHAPNCRLINRPSTIKQDLHQPPDHLHLSAAMSSWKHKCTMHKVQNFSCRSLGSHTGSERTIPRPRNSYFGFGDQPALGSSINAVVVDRSLLEPLQLNLDPCNQSAGEGADQDPQ